jgi:cytochrome P450
MGFLDPFCSKGMGCNSLAAALGVFLGLTLHYGLFIHGEWHTYSPELLVIHTTLYGSLAIGSVLFRGNELGDMLFAALIMSIVYLLTLFTSMVVYRSWFHPLTRAGFKGPFYLRTSKLWHFWISLKSKNHLFMDGLHKQYGDFVRTGPNEITCFHPDFGVVTDAVRSECGKGEWYDLLLPESSLLTTRDRPVHDSRRKDWKVGFTASALNHHFARMIKHIQIFDKLLAADAKAGRPTKTRDVFYWLGFDFMGDFIFNESFQMLEKQGWHYMIIKLQRALSLLGPVSPLPWLFPIAFRMAPRIGQVADWADMADWTHSQIAARLEAGADKQKGPDLVHYLLENKGGPRTHEDFLKMRGDSLNAIVAGSELVPTVLLGLFSELARKPEHIDGVYQELKDENIEDAKVLSKLPYLNAIITEALRLYPVIPSGAPRKAGPNGVTIGDVFIPPHTTIYGPRFTVQRSKSIFNNPLAGISGCSVAS